MSDDDLKEPIPARRVPHGMLAAMAMMGLSHGGIGFGGGRKEQPEKPCLKCGKLKVHNNDFCSAECCKQYRLEKKGKS